MIKIKTILEKKLTELKKEKEISSQFDRENTKLFSENSNLVDKLNLISLELNATKEINLNKESEFENLKIELENLKNEFNILNVGNKEENEKRDNLILEKERDIEKIGLHYQQEINCLKDEHDKKIIILKDDLKEKLIQNDDLKKCVIL